MKQKMKCSCKVYHAVSSCCKCGEEAVVESLCGPFCADCVSFSHCGNLEKAAKAAMGRALSIAHIPSAKPKSVPLGELEDWGCFVPGCGKLFPRGNGGLQTPQVEAILCHVRTHYGLLHN